MRGYALPAESYEGPFIFGALVSSLWPLPLTSLGNAALAVAWLVVLALFAARGRQLLCDWQGLDHGTAQRPLIMACVVVSAWTFSSYDYNLYLGQGHWGDRLLLVALVPLVWLRPIFVVPFVLEAVAVMGQFQHPLGGYHPTHVILPLHVLFLLPASLGLRAIGVPLKCRDLVFVVLLVVASGYFHSGVAKMELGWLSYGRVYNVMFAPYANGWLGFLRPENVSAIGRALVPLDPLLMLGTLTLEIGVLGLFWRRSSAVALLVWAALFHLGVLTLSGIFFWSWIVIDLTLAWWLLSPRGRSAYPIFSRQAFLTSLVLIPGAVLWFRPASLSWLDSPVNYTYRFDGVAQSGARYPLPPSFFAPYEYDFTLGYFESWDPEPRLAIRWGAVSDLAIANALIGAKTPEGVAAIEERFGRIHFDAEQAAVRDRFIERWLLRQRERGATAGWLSFLQAPRQLLGFAPEGAFRGQETICEVEVTRVTSWFDGALYREIDVHPTRSIPIPATPGCTTGPRD